jgi:outer membrane protein assembly factor BamB
MVDGSTGRLLRTFRSPTPSAKEAFGNHIATLDNKVVVVGACVWESKTRGGAVYLFDASTGKLLQTLKSPAEAPGNRFGRSLATLGNKVIVGAGSDDTRAENAGAVYVFAATTGEHLQSIYKPNPAAGDHFGISVAALGNDILVSALGGGAAYLFRGVAEPSAGKAD